MLRAAETAAKTEVGPVRAGRPAKNVLMIAEGARPPQPLAAVLQELGYACQMEADPRALFQFPDIRRIDLVLVLVRPDDPTSWNVLQLVAELIAATHLPLVGVGEHLSVDDRLRVFETGARECLTLELPAEELKVRLNLLGRSKQRLDMIIDQNLSLIHI